MEKSHDRISSVKFAKLNSVQWHNRIGRANDTEWVGGVIRSTKIILTDPMHDWCTSNIVSTHLTFFLRNISKLFQYAAIPNNIDSVTDWCLNTFHAWSVIWKKYKWYWMILSKYDINMNSFYWFESTNAKWMFKTPKTLMSNWQQTIWTNIKTGHHFSLLTQTAHLSIRFAAARPASGKDG